MSTILTPEQENLVQNLLGTGRFSTSEEVIQTALWLLEKEEQAWIEQTKAKIDEGFAALERGETLDGETFVNQLLEKFEQAKEAHQ